MVIEQQNSLSKSPFPSQLLLDTLVVIIADSDKSAIVIDFGIQDDKTQTMAIVYSILSHRTKHESQCLVLSVYTRNPSNLGIYRRHEITICLIWITMYIGPRASYVYDFLCTSTTAIYHV